MLEAPAARRILLIEDEPVVSSMFQRALTREGFAVDAASNGKQAAAMSNTSEYAAIVLDWHLPDVVGSALCHQLAQSCPDTPILVLTADECEETEQEALIAGADDVAHKDRRQAFLIRLRRLTERRAWSQDIEVGSIRLHKATREVIVDADHVKLSRLEYKLLAALLASAPQPVTVGELGRRYWGRDAEFNSNVVHSRVRALRRRVASLGLSIVSDRGNGYRLYGRGLLCDPDCLCHSD